MLTFFAVRRVIRFDFGKQNYSILSKLLLFAVGIWDPV